MGQGDLHHTKAVMCEIVSGGNSTPASVGAGAGLGCGCSSGSGSSLLMAAADTEWTSQWINPSQQLWSNLCAVYQTAICSDTVRNAHAHTHSHAHTLSRLNALMR